MFEEEAPGYTSLADPALLDKIDSLFACNIGEYINLPQLVVVGDQSSGKSSVLEGLTRLPFPRDSGLCTRFATQLIFRRNKNLTTRRISSSIIPASDSHPTRAGELQAWDRSFEGSLSPVAFAAILEEAHRLMGVSTPDKPTKLTFSKDILRLEICGPDEDHLSVIDVPGIFKLTTPGRTTKADIQLVREMVLGYMRNPRSILLTVVAANVDVANQEIIEMAREVDPDGERTLGVLTKPDLVDKGAEQKILDIIAGRELPLKYGWILVRNLGQREMEKGIVDRDTAEAEFGKTELWSTVAVDRYGISSLKTRLQDTVTENARRTFPMVRAEINRKLKEAKTGLVALSSERDTTSQQLRYLLDAVTRFNIMTTQALGTHYGADENFTKYKELRLATLVVNREVLFARYFEKWGHKYEFKVNSIRDDVEIVSPESGGDEPAQFSASTRPGALNFHSTGEGELDHPGSRPTRFKTRMTEPVMELEDVLTNQEIIEKPLRQGIHEWLRDEYHNSRGFELNSFSIPMLTNAFNQQTIKWQSIALGYLSDIIVVVHKFIMRNLEISLADRRVFRNLLPHIMGGLLEVYKEAMEHVRLLLCIEREGTLKTLDRYFNDHLQNIRHSRWKAYVGGKEVNGILHVGDLDYQQDMSNESHTVQELHDILECYYKVALSRFVDNVSMQAADYHLVNGPNAPMKLISPAFVHGFSAETLQEIAGEDPAVRRRRTQLKKQIAELEKGKRLLI
ncbi:dynamin family protein [Aspergillus fijiensis CBS 313.89]|uniref:Vacuolar sorting protein VPS1, dynamin n=1 Tax=Aspergillus fijiensis CBS 313.89 TaxID=1448319 RepID=A0A8G1RS38_9EURO|nr:vacuolar sorting protein VPS1, dynamin [Aspergillus fijiensis CBS 313.89]RAK77758.1 vacuolar sorting protein VPS1, dynamin [Aspergillus fijiensis CBS 313.89]